MKDIPGITSPAIKKENQPGEPGPIRQAFGAINDDLKTRIGNEIITGYNSVITPRERVLPTEEELARISAKKEKKKQKRERSKEALKVLIKRLFKIKEREIIIRPAQPRLLGSGKKK